MIKPETIHKALASIQKGRANYEYFFAHLTSAEWIEPLSNEGFFTEPPPVNQVDGRIMVMRWPETEFLARVASQAPSAVIAIFKRLPQTDNPRVHEDIADAALAMSPADASNLVPLVKKSLRKPHLLLLPRKASSLIGHLVGGGETAPALGLFHDLLRFKPKTTDEETTPFRRDPAAYIDDYTYQKTVEHHAVALANQTGKKTFDILSALLLDYTRKSRRSGETGPEDLSCISRPAIENNNQNRALGLYGTLVIAARDTAAIACGDGEHGRQDVLRTLRAQPWRIFHRIGLYLLATLPGVGVGEAGEWLLDRDLFEGYSTRHEYVLALKRFFRHLGSSGQDTLLSWMDEHDLEQIAERISDKRGVPLTLEEAQQIADHERLKWLTQLEADLPPAWKDRYDALIAKYGVPSHPDFPVYSSGTLVGPTSPKTVDELKSMSIEQLVEYAKNWQAPPDKGFDMPPSMEGLGRTITQLATETPTVFADEARQFIGSDPTYVRAVLAGLRQAIRQSVIIDWTGILELSQWVLSQPYSGPTNVVRFDGPDPDWSWTRQGIAEIIGAGLQSDLLPLDLRTTVWGIITTLANDPDPIADIDQSDNTRQLDPATTSFNSVRGQALDGVVQYALWVRRGSGTDSAEPELNDTPEVTALLSAHLDVTIDPSLAIRSIYGRWFPWLSLIDRAWAIASIDQIFPAGEEQLNYWLAAWTSYISFCHPYDDAFGLLRLQYVRAVRMIAELDEPDAERLINHVLVFYLRGLVLIDDELLTTFFATASGKYRDHAFQSLGSMLEQSTDAIVERAKALWDRRINECVEVKSPLHVQEAASFGWLFASGHFDPAWSLSNLARTLQFANRIADGDSVIEHLATLASDYPEDALTCLRLIVDSEKDDWSLSFWQDGITAVLSAVLATGLRETQGPAIDLIHRLGSMGYSGYRNLIVGTRPDSDT